MGISAEDLEAALVLGDSVGGKQKNDQHQQESYSHHALLASKPKDSSCRNSEIVAGTGPSRSTLSGGGVVIAEIIRLYQPYADVAANPIVRASAKSCCEGSIPIRIARRAVEDQLAKESVSVNADSVKVRGNAWSNQKCAQAIRVAVGRTVSAPEVDFRSQVRHELECSRGFPSVETVSLPRTAIESENRIAGIGVPPNTSTRSFCCAFALREKKTPSRRKSAGSNLTFIKAPLASMKAGHFYWGKGGLHFKLILIWLTSHL
jgi:hypothetical protein